VVAVSLKKNHGVAIGMPGSQEPGVKRDLILGRNCSVLKPRLMTLGHFVSLGLVC